MNKLYFRRYLVLLVFLIPVISCNNRISIYDQSSYEQAVKLKVEALILIDNASTPYKEKVKDIEDFKKNLQIAYEYSKGRKDNAISTAQWEVIINKDENSMATFLELWKEQGNISPKMCENWKKQAAKMFDRIIELESDKVK